MRGFARTFADAARASGRTVVAYQYSPLGGPLDAEIVQTLHGAQVPFLLGTSNAMGALKISAGPARLLGTRRHAGDRRIGRAAAPADAPAFASDPQHWDFLTARAALVASGVPVVEARIGALRSGRGRAPAPFRHRSRRQGRGAGPPAQERPRLRAARLRERARRAARPTGRSSQNARKAGFEHGVGVLIQPMIEGVAEAYAGIIDDPRFGPAICFGLGGVFVEILRDTVTEMAPLSRDDALRMIRGIKAAPILDGARGRARADIEALADAAGPSRAVRGRQPRPLPRARPQSDHRRDVRRRRGRYRDRTDRADAERRRQRRRITPANGHGKEEQ